MVMRTRGRISRKLLLAEHLLYTLNASHKVNCGSTATQLRRVRMAIGTGSSGPGFLIYASLS